MCSDSPQDNDRPLKWLKLQEFTYIDNLSCVFLYRAWPHLFRRFTLDSTNWVLKLHWGRSSELVFFFLSGICWGWGHYYCSALNYSKHPSIFKGLLEFTYWQLPNSMGKHYTKSFVVLPNLFKQKFCFKRRPADIHTIHHRHN